MKLWFESVKLSSYIQVGALPSYNASNLKDIKIHLPDKKEQAKIGNFFQQFDRLINQHQTQIQKLNHIKQALLSKMFV